MKKLQETVKMGKQVVTSFAATANQDVTRWPKMEGTEGRRPPETTNPSVPLSQDEDRRFYRLRQWIGKVSDKDSPVERSIIFAWSRKQGVLVGSFLVLRLYFK
jgi:hypothetical protein